jgi:ATP-dependent Zn protease
LAALVNEAALLALRNNDLQVTIEHFHQVKDKVMFGKKKLQMLSDKQKEYRITYQAGKVVSATYFDFAFEKIMLSNEKLTPSIDEPMIKHELESRVKMLLAGMVACEIKFGEHTSSAKGDLDEAKELVQKMLHEYGMGASVVCVSHEEEHLMGRLYSECRELMNSMDSVMRKVESVLGEKESISKDEVKKYMNEIF